MGVKQDSCGFWRIHQGFKWRDALVFKAYSTDKIRSGKVTLQIKNKSIPLCVIRLYHIITVKYAAICWLTVVCVCPHWQGWTQWHSGCNRLGSEAVLLSAQWKAGDEHFSESLTSASCCNLSFGDSWYYNSTLEAMLICFSASTLLSLLPAKFPAGHIVIIDKHALFITLPVCLRLTYCHQSI